jgi:hypothetical protein
VSGLKVEATTGGSPRLDVRVGGDDGDDVDPDAIHGENGVAGNPTMRVADGIHAALGACRLPFRRWWVH